MPAGRPAAAAAGSALHCRHSLPQRPPHVLMLMADDLGFHDTSYAGSSVVSTPHLDALARRATHLSQFRAPTWCAPSRASFLTGRHGWELATASGFATASFGEDALLLSEALRGLGYRTAIVGKFHVPKRTCSHFHTSGGPFGCGFDAQYGFVGGMSDYWEHHHSWSRDGKLLREKGYVTELLGQEAARLVHAHADEHANASLFLWLASSAPHTPFQAPEPWLRRQPPRLVDNRTVGKVRTYAAMVGAMDESFGTALGALRQREMLSSSLVLFVSDNGGPMIQPACNGGLRGGKGSPYDGGVRVPAFVYWPSCLGSRRKVSAAPGHMVDLYSTILMAASLRLSPDGRRSLALRLRRKAPHSVSLWPALVSATAGEHVRGRRSAVGAEVPAELHRRRIVLQASATSASVLRGRWKLVVAATKCFGVDRAVSHNESIRGFRADRWLLSGGREGSRRATLHLRLANLSGSERLGAARQEGDVDLQLYDLRHDPSESVDLLSAAEASAERPRREALAGLMLGQYLSAARVGQRSIEAAIAEGRLGGGQRGTGRGPRWEMPVWFCRQLQLSWGLAEWRGTRRSTVCRLRTKEEAGRIETYALGARRSAPPRV